ncbi:MAG: hypothetical protein HY819_07585 [Acidobacteria bacterium]|nr:hypothetical protein [Acidobacteriota bacterium]
MDDFNKRLVLRQIETIDQEDGSYRIQVTLSTKGTNFVGQATGKQHEDKLNTAAMATLQAVASALDKPFKLSVKGVNASEAFEGLEETLLVVVVSIDDGEAEMITPGSCRNTGDSVDAVVKATLDATNRLVEANLA